MAELCLSALCPRVAIYETDDVTKLLSEQCGLPDLATLLKPWQQAGVERVQIRSSTFETITAPTFPLRFDRAEDVREETAYEREGGWLDSFANKVNSRLEDWLDNLPVDAQTPWYDLFLNELLDMRSMHPHDTFSHPVACILAVSCAHPEPLNALAALYAATSPTELFRDRQYADPAVLRYYVVVHDVRNGDLQESQSLLEQIRRAYGVHCALLPINSLDLEAPPPLEGEKDSRPPYFDGLWSPYIDTAGQRRILGGGSPMPEAVKLEGSVEPGSGLGHKDVFALRVFLREFVVQSLLPWMERNIQQWNEQLTATRRGLTNRFFSAGRKYFGSKPASPAAGGPPGFLPAKGFYPFQSQEAQARKLADFAFITRDYRLATSTYELVRKDNQNDKAWRDYASSTRMLGLSQLLAAIQAGPAGQGRVDVDGLFDQANAASNAVATPSAQMDELKLTCLFVAAYLSNNDYEAAAQALSRCAGDVEEVSSGLLLEQAAIIHLLPMRQYKRKTAFYLCLAATRYAKSGVKHLAQRCLQQAEAIYGADAREWRYIRDYVQHTLGRQSYSNGKADTALVHFLRLLAAGSTSEDTGEDDQQSYLHDFEQAYKQLGDNAESTVAAKELSFPQRFFDLPATVLRHSVDQEEGSAVGEATWRDLEERTQAEARASEPVLAAATIKESKAFVVASDEPFYLACQVRNPLAAEVALDNLALDVETLTGPADAAHAEPQPKLVLGPHEVVTMHFALSAASECRLRIKGVSYRLNGHLECFESLVKRGPRLIKTREQRLEPTYGEDSSLDVLVRTGVPRLSVQLSNMPSTLYEGEMVTAEARVTNTGQVDLQHLRIASGDPAFCSLAQSSPVLQEGQLTVSNSLTSATSIVILLGDKLAAEDDLTLMLSLRADRVGSHAIPLLFVYASTNSPKELHVARAPVIFEVQPLLDLRPTVRLAASREAPFRVELELRNRHAESSVRIESVAALSRFWQCERLAGELPELHADQMSTVVLRSSRDASDADADADFDFTARQLERQLTGRKLNEEAAGDVSIRASALDDSSALVDCLSPYLASRRQHRLDHLGQAFAALPPHLLQHMFELFMPRSLDILVQYSTEGEGQSRRQGFVLASDLRLGPAEGALHMQKVFERAEGIAGGLYAESQIERGLILAAFKRSEYSGSGVPVTVTYEVPQAITLDVSEQLPRKLQLHLRLCNLAMRRIVDYQLDLRPPVQDDGDVTSSSQTAAFLGKLIHRGTLQPGESVSIACQVWLTGEGTFDVSQWRLALFDKQAGLSWDTAGHKRLIHVRTRPS